MGNLTSVGNAILSIGFEPVCVSSAERMEQCDGIILPGVGAFPEAMKRMKGFNLIAEIRDYCNTGRPFVGICLGMQLMFEWSDEMGGSEGIGLIPGKVVRIPAKKGFAIPHMGWNDVETVDEGFKELVGDYYFVHSYMCKPENKSDILFECEYSERICAAVKHSKNIYGFQFHPEKSQRLGLALLARVFADA